ncbi:isoleucine--tRNA ligase [Mycoplasma sp. Ms02]|uniref:isoleucine--tRNA ligase n=1 Tax=Mycoplasma sp. Ms02 TaxID=353851 RepID=UPI001C897384|nr:isoleucine--tRNA ligase [Mycoplasma sp. Ms02]QZE12236.1 isoleucine--tRNA ligase [Mycoplasma sp. Ms02]
MDYKKTLNMPQTSFEMKANLIQKEQVFRKRWEDNQIYKKIMEQYKDKPQFILHDGPPYANGDIHVGHASNKILKDIIVRYKTLQGFYSPFIAGWDAHGLPIEHKMLTELSAKQEDFSPLIIRKKAATYAKKQVERQRKQFKELQLFSDLEDIYVTLDKKFVAKQLKLFKKMALDGLIYNGLKPVYWSPSSKSALAEAEVEYRDVVSPSTYVGFPIVKSANEKVHLGDRLVIWTTTPWTLIANAGVALGESFQYARVQYDGQVYIVANDLIEKLQAEFNWQNIKVLDVLEAKELVGSIYQTPILKTEAPVVIGHHVTLEAGSGLVHIAPMFGEDDFLIGRKNNLESIMHISDSGMIENFSQYQGLFYSKANPVIIEDLQKEGLLVLSKEFTHSYPHDWRTDKPIMFRGTPQWFVSLDNIRQAILNEVEKVNTHPEWAKKRLYSMIENRQDWTISRQRSWGVPIIIFYDQDKKPVISEEIFDHVIALVEQHGADIWWEKTADELLPEKYQNQGFTKEMDIMDVWFDSGSTSIAVDIPNAHPSYDLYLEGVDQYRGWFNSSIINAVVYYGKTPYKNLISHGFVVDGNGEKMSKSKGNTVSPSDIVKQRGAEILRLWAANSEYSNDFSISEGILDQNSELYRKIRNTIRFMLGNLKDFDYNPNIKREGIDLYIKNQLEALKASVINHYDEYRFLNVVKEINNYIVELSSFYLSVTKDILYTYQKNSVRRLAVLTNLYEIVEFLIIALAPILPTTSEEAYDHFNKKDKKESVMFEAFPQPGNVDHALLDQYKEFFDLRDKVNGMIENAVKQGLIKRSNEAKIYLNEKTDLFSELDLKTLLMVGDVEFGHEEEKLEVFDSVKCERCWNHFMAEQIHEGLCANCYSVIKSLTLLED